MKTPQGKQKWRVADVARYLIANRDYHHWEIEESGEVLWMCPDGMHHLMMDDREERYFAVKRFVTKRGSVTRAELISEFGDVD
ncbi:MAG: hypothetical protein ACSHX6_02965 [Akkermansiaceae bacterium]